MPSPPLAWSYDGESFEPPDDAVGWRVRRKVRPGRGARTEAVRVQVGQNSAELVVELWAPPEHVRFAVGGAPGAYRLDPIDEDGWVLRGEPAFVYIAESAVTDFDLRLYPDLLAEATTDHGWRVYLETLALGEAERSQCESLKWRLPIEQFIVLRSELLGVSQTAAVEILRTWLRR